MAKLISLEGAIVVVPSGWVANAGEGIFSINATISAESWSVSCNTLLLGYVGDNEEMFPNGMNLYVKPNIKSVFTATSFTLEIVDGTDVANQQLIQWFLDNNAEITGGIWESDPIKQIKPFLTNIANAIRTKKGTTEPINAQNFASEIESIESGGLTGYTGTVSFQTTISGSAHSYILIKPDLTMEIYRGAGDANHTINTPVIAVCCFYLARLASVQFYDGSMEYSFLDTSVVAVFTPNKDNFTIYCRDDD